jgi:hypothetical protein
MMTLYLLRNACTTSDVSITKNQSSLTYDVAIESSTNIATVGGKQKWVKHVTKFIEMKRNGMKQNEMYTKTGRECNLVKRIYRNGTKQNMSKHTTVHACSKPDLDDHWS